MEHGLQRGSVLDMPMYPGEPLTPGSGAKPDVERLAIEDAPTIMKIPVMPISYADALAKYGSDKPDLRNPLIINDITEVFLRDDVSFEIFKKKDKRFF